MSSLERMRVQGVRSFDSNDPQVISFNKPLTIIVGRNGVGKTTIIECLRYATTGSLPPGAKGDGFLHDPRLDDQADVRAQVQLQFTNLSGMSVTVTRAMQLTSQASGKKTFKTLDSSMKFTDAHGQPSISSRCADLNVEMSHQLGVSKAVLENVIFCHQEDSLWPLGDSTTVKKKFDDMFASTRYTQAIKEMGSLKDAKAIDLKIAKQKLADLEVHKTKAAEIKQKIDDDKRRIRDNNADADQMQRDLDELASQITELEGQLAELDSIGRKIQEKQHTINLKQVELDELKDIRKFKESEQELQQMLENHRKHLDEARRSNGDLDARRERVQGEIALVDKEIMRENENLGRIKEREKNHEKDVGSRDRLIREAARRFGMAANLPEKLTTESAERFVESLRTKLTDSERDLARKREDLKARLRQIDDDLQKHIRERSTHEATLNSNRRNIDDLKQANTKTDVEILRMQVSQADKETKRRDIATARQQLDAHERRMAAASLVQSVKTLEADLARIEKEHDALVNMQTRIAAFADLRAKVDVTQQEADRERADATRKFNDARARFDKALANAAAADLTVENCQQSITNALNDANRDLQRLSPAAKEANDAFVRARQDKDNVQRQLDDAQDQLDNLRAAHPDLDDVTDIAATLRQLDAEVSESEKNISFSSSFKDLYDKFVSLAEKRHSCPLCSRPLSSNHGDQDSLDAFVVKQRQTIASLPGQIAEENERLVEINRRRDRCRELQPSWMQYQALSSARVPELVRQRDETAERVTELERTSIKAQNDLRDLNARIDNLRNLQAHCAQIAAHLQKAAQAARNVTIQRDQLAAMQGQENATVNIQEDLRTLQMNRDNVRVRLQEARDTLARDEETRRRLQQDAQRLEQEDRVLDEKLDRRALLEAQLALNEEQIDELDRGLGVAEVALQEMEEKITTKTAERKNAETGGEESTGDVQRHIAQLKDDLRKILETVESINSYVRSGADRERGVASENLNKLQSRRRTLEETDARLIQESADLEGSLRQIKDVERDVSLFLRFAHTQRDVVGLRAELEQLRRDGQRYGPAENLEAEKAQLSAQKRDLENKKATHEGSVKELRRNIQTRERELLEPPYETLDEDFHGVLLTVRTLEMAITDLDKYMKAVDKAIMSYHSMKMKEINMIMRELWVDIYQGQDIDVIEIHSESEKTGARGSYNYRVVMNKGGVELDMRGRCSAGQKVLACLLIRLALAETFGLNCGVLALDEPTTNLDYENSERLALALDRIIKLRSRQRNFQLLVITHDENFMRKLSNHAEYYYQVRKNPQTHNSVIKKINMNEFI